MRSRPSSVSFVHHHAPSSREKYGVFSLGSQRKEPDIHIGTNGIYPFEDLGTRCTGPKPMTSLQAQSLGSSGHVHIGECSCGGAVQNHVLALITD